MTSKMFSDFPRPWDGHPLAMTSKERRMRSQIRVCKAIIDLNKCVPHGWNIRMRRDGKVQFNIFRRSKTILIPIPRSRRSIVVALAGMAFARDAGRPFISPSFPYYLTWLRDNNHGNQVGKILEANRPKGNDWQQTRADIKASVERVIPKYLIDKAWMRAHAKACPDAFDCGGNRNYRSRFSYQINYLGLDVQQFPLIAAMEDRVSKQQEKARQDALDAVQKLQQINTRKAQ